MQTSIEKVLHKIYGSSQQTRFTSASLMSGEAGKGLFQFHYEKLFADKNLFQHTVQAVSENLQTVNGATLANGRAGTDWFFYFLYKQDVLEKDDLDFFCSNMQQLSAIALQMAKAGNFDFLHGATGITHYLLHNQFLTDKNFFEEFFSVLKNAVHKNTHACILPEYDFIQHHVSSNTVNLGMAHGIFSVLKLCVDCYNKNVCAQQSKQIAYSFIEFIYTHTNKAETTSMFSNRINFITKTETQSRLAWCYGDLIAGYILQQAAKSFNDDKLRNFAIDIVQATTLKITTQQTNIHDACFCHGSAGLAYMYKKLFFQTKENAFNEAANYWLEKTLTFASNENNFLKMFNASTKNYTNNYSLLDGIYGTALVLYSFLSNDFNWDSCFMLNM